MNNMNKKNNGHKIEAIIVTISVICLLGVIGIWIWLSNKSTGTYYETRIVKAEAIPAEEAGYTVDENYEYMKITVDEVAVDKPSTKKETSTEESSAKELVDVIVQETSSAKQSDTVESNVTEAVVPTQANNNNKTNNNSNATVVSGRYTTNTNSNRQQTQQTQQATTSKTNNNQPQVTIPTNPTEVVVQYDYMEPTVSHRKNDDGQYEIIIRYDKNNPPTQEELDELVQKYIEEHRDELIEYYKQEQQSTSSEEQSYKEDYSHSANESTENNTIKDENSTDDEEFHYHVTMPDYTTSEETSSTSDRPKPTHGAIYVGGSITSGNEGTVIAGTMLVGYNHIVSLTWHVEAINGNVELSDTNNPLVKNIYIDNKAAARIYVTAVYDDGVEVTSNTALIKHPTFIGRLN